MRVYLGTLNNILDASIHTEAANNLDCKLVCVCIKFEEHSGIVGDVLTFCCPATSLKKLRAALKNIKEY